MILDCENDPKISQYNHRGLSSTYIFKATWVALRQSLWEEKFSMC